MAAILTAHDLSTGTGLSTAVLAINDKWRVTATTSGCPDRQRVTVEFLVTGENGVYSALLDSDKNAITFDIVGNKTKSLVVEGVNASGGKIRVYPQFGSTGLISIDSVTSEALPGVTQITDPSGNVLNPSGTPHRDSIEITRPNNTTAYTALDCISNLAANVKQKDTITLTGTEGTVNISIPNIANRDLDFDTSLTITAAAFVTDYAADFLPLVVVTSSGEDIIFEAATAGVPFSSPVVTNTVTDLDGTVVNTTANATIAAFEFENMSITNGGGGYIMDLKLETDITDMTAKAVRVWIFNEAPTGVVGDNVAFVTSYANKDKLIGFIDVTMEALIGSSTSVVGQTSIIQQYNCAIVSLFFLVEAVDAFTPTANGKINVTINVLKIS